jgi:SAM domain (Sterile alpha motif)
MFAKAPASKTPVQHDNVPSPALSYPPPYGCPYPVPMWPAGQLPTYMSLPKMKTPSLYRFLSDLERELDKPEGTFMQFEHAFSAEEIEVQHIKNLSDQEMSQLGIVKIGWRKALRDASAMYN